MHLATTRSNTRLSTFLAFLERFPTPASITAHSKEAFIDRAWDVAGRKVSKGRLLGDIYETARSSIGLPVALDSLAVSILRMVVAEGRSLIRQRDAIEEEAHAALAEHADYQRLRQIPGIAPINAMTILAEAGDLRHFRHHRQFLKRSRPRHPPVRPVPGLGEAFQARQREAEARLLGRRGFERRQALAARSGAGS
jgi:hypothetical protein